jgi:hypothetical protein
VRVEVRGFESELQSAFDLRAQLGLDLLRSGLRRRLPFGAPHKTLFVEQSLDLFRRSHRTPTQIFPFAGQSEMQSQIELRMLSGVSGDLGEPRAGNHDAARSDQAFFEGFDCRDIDRMRHADVVGMNHQNFVVRAVAELLRCGRLRKRRGTKQKQTEHD